MKKLELHINGVKKDVVRLDFVFTSMIQERELIKNAVEKLKVDNRFIIVGKDWEIYLIAASSMSEPIETVEPNY